MKILSKKLRQTVKKEVVVPLVAASSTMLERALSTVLNLLSHLDADLGDDEAIYVFGCTECYLIYDPCTYHSSSHDVESEHHPQYDRDYCPVCGTSGMVLLGPLPETLDRDQGSFLVDSEGNSLGPFTDPTKHLWEWFNERSNGICEEEEDRGKILHLITAEKSCSSQEKEDSQKEHSQEGSAKSKDRRKGTNGEGES